MVTRGYFGRKSGRGFYRDEKGKTGRPFIAVHSSDYRSSGIRRSEMTGPITADDIRDRIVLRLANEAAKCLQEGGVSEPWSIDLPIVLGTGFVPFTGGPLRMCKLQGYGETVAKLEYFEKTLGSRFAPAAWLIEQIERPHEHHAW